MEIPYYLKISKAKNLEQKKERGIYRFFEILPGAFSWLTLISLILLSWLKPSWIAIFIITFAIYWFSRGIYFSFHLRASYRQLRKNEKTNWLKKLSRLPPSEYSLPLNDWHQLYQLIVLPMYQEPLEIVRESFNSLLNSDWSNSQMIIVLSIEEKRGKEGREIAEIIKREFGDKPFKLLVTFHPQNLPGEIPGKGSNEAWGGKVVKQKIIDPLKIPYQNIIYSSFDIDTAVFPQYFSILAFNYLTVKEPTRCSFQPIPLFVNNIWKVPPIARVFSFSATFWQMMCQERPEKLITFSSHSMSFKALTEVGFRQTDVVSDDSRIFWQCFLQYNGNYRVVPLYYPISMDANCAPTFFQTLKNVYKQQRRWAYGAADIAYAFFGFLKNKEISLSKKISLGFTIFEGHWSWATNSIILFLLGWLPIILGGSGFNQTLLSYKLPGSVAKILTIAMLGLIASAYFSILLLPPRPLDFGKRKYILLVLEWFLIPIVMIFFTSFPSLEAQTRLMLGKYMGFWPTPKTRPDI